MLQQSYITFDRITRSVLWVLALYGFWVDASAQVVDAKKIRFSSYARGLLSAEGLREKSDSLGKKALPGYALTDLGLHVLPHSQVEIHAQLRVRSEYGGFWGSGLTLDLRQMWIRGLVNQKIRYQLGDVDYKMSPFTFYNPREWVLSGPSMLNGPTLNMIEYDLFQNNQHTRRQQGVVLEWGGVVDPLDLMLNASVFTTRVAASDFGATPDRLLGGGRLRWTLGTLMHGKFNFVQLYDVARTANQPYLIHHPVLSAEWGLAPAPEQGRRWALDAEAGLTRLGWIKANPNQANLEDRPTLTDGFGWMRWAGPLGRPRKGGSYWQTSLEAWYTGSDYRSAAAQTKRINATRSPLAFKRFEGMNAVRPMSLQDLYRDASLYQTQVMAGLMEYDPGYGNAMPYGMATPNRQALSLRIHSPSDTLSFWSPSLEMQVLSDVKGQGVSNRRVFWLADFQNSWRLHRLWNLRRPWLVSASVRLEQTSRPDVSGDAIQSGVNLNNRQVSVQSSWDLGSSWSAFAEWQHYYSKGRDYYPLRNAYSEVVDYTAAEMDRAEQWIGAGLRYQMGDRFEAQLSSQQFVWRNGTSSMQARYPWNMSQLMLIMKL